MKYSPLLLALLLVGCSTPPTPSSHNTGPVAAQQNVPQAPILYIPSPAHALLGTNVPARYATDLVEALGRHDVPCAAGMPPDGDWELLIAVARTGDQIIPAYHILGPNGTVYGKLDGAPVPARLWERADPTILAQTANRDSSNISKLLANINATVQLNNPNSLINRTPLLFVGHVTGAPGDGNISLPADLTHDLSNAALKLVPKVKDADFSVTGTVKTIPTTPGNVVIEVNWIIRDGNDRLVGQVTQLHQLKASAIAGNWGGVALSLAQEASNGVSTVIHNEIKRLRAEAIH